jgi:Domain of unknown function (DUF5658)
VGRGAGIRPNTRRTTPVLDFRRRSRSARNLTDIEATAIMTPSAMTQKAGTTGLAEVWKNRSRRIMVLLVGIVLLSAADLLVTLTYARNGGMMEANPIVLYLAQVTQSPWVLAAYKVATVSTCVILLYSLRRYAISEAAAWCAVAILACMSFMWRDYASQLNDSQAALLVKCDDQTDHWLTFDSFD